jgi:hypothetical protein
VTHGLETKAVVVARDVAFLLHVNTLLDNEAVQRRCPASHYVMVGDKPRLPAAMKRSLGEKLTTVFVRQGHYAAESAGGETLPPPDLSLERIGDLMGCDLSPFLSVTTPRRAAYWRRA